MRPQAAHAIVKTGVSWLIFATGFWLMAYVWSDGVGTRAALAFVREGRSEEALKWLMPSALVLVAIVGVAAVFIRQNNKCKHFKELCGEIIETLASAFTIVSSATFFLSFREPAEFLAMLVAIPISFILYWAAKELGA
ncbi:hypothetical protein [Thermomonas sp. XSG]|uniref:hypothetical protein n=1 Tax=Thermomonas sp. XSG TaxID=2771436 RepID=UPI001680B04B|nr:hypothetical protein [Thermomonas sp. XSG]QNU15046.1 hypothetical protein ICG51_001372 [Thermomonas sp. XSG]